MGAVGGLVPRLRYTLYRWAFFFPYVVVEIFESREKAFCAHLITATFRTAGMVIDSATLTRWEWGLVITRL